MASVLEIVRGISQAAANAYDGALDENGDLLEVGLKREEDVSITDRRVMDGFKIGFHGPRLCVKYHSEVSLKEVHEKNKFETDIESMLSEIVKFLKKEYRKVTGESISLTADGDANILVQNISNLRTWVQADQFYKVGGLGEAVDDLKQESDPDRLDTSIKSWLGSNGNLERAPGSGLKGKEKHPRTKKAKNVSGTRDLEPKTLWKQRSHGKGD